MNDNKVAKGTARWYQPRTNDKGTSIPGKFSVKKEIADKIPFGNGEEVIVELDTETNTVSIKKL
jgi:hypothetical protein